jgi:hypothetical protein
MRKRGKVYTYSTSSTREVVKPFRLLVWPLGPLPRPLLNLPPLLRTGGIFRVSEKFSDSLRLSYSSWQT